MAFLTMEVDGFVGGSEESRFSPCFLRLHAAFRLSVLRSLNDPGMP
jgi:hypothetical protein